MKRFKSEVFQQSAIGITLTQYLEYKLFAESECKTLRKAINSAKRV